MLRRSVIVLAVLVGALAGTVIALKSPRVARNVQEYLSRIVYDKYGIRLEIEKLSLELAPPGLVAERIAAYRADDREPWLSAQRGRVSLQPWPSPSGALVIHHLEVDGLHGKIDLAPALARASAAKDSGAQGDIDIDIVTLLLWNTHLVVDTGHERVTLRGADLALQPARGAGRDLDVAIAQVVIERAERRLALEAALRARLHGSIDRPQSLVIERAYFDTDGAGLGVTGTFGLGEHMQIDLVGEAHAPLEVLRAWLPSLPPIDGEASARVEVQGSPARLHSKAQLKLGELKDARRSLGDVEVELAHAGKRIQVASLRYQHRALGTVTGSGWVDLDPALSAAFKLRLHGLSLPALLDLAGLPDAHVRGGVQGDVALSGTLNPLRLEAQIDSGVTGFEVLNVSFREPSARSFLTLAATSLRGPFVVTSRAVTLNGLHLQRGASLFQVEGTLSYDPSLGLDLRASGETVDLAELGPIAGVMFTGAGTVAASVEGPYRDPTVSGAVDMRELSAQGFLVGDTKATLIYRGRRLEADRVTVRRAAGTIAGAGSMDFREGRAAVEGAFAIDDVDARDLLLTAGVTPGFAQKFRARLRGNVQLAGPLAAPTGSFALRAPELRLGEGRLSDLRLEGEFGGSTEKVRAEIVLNPARGAEIRTELKALPHGELHIAADLKHVSVEALRSLMGGVPLSGALTGTAQLAGPPGALSGEIKVTADQLVAYGLRLATARLEGVVERGEVSITGTLLDGDVPVVATLDLSRTLDHSARMTFNKLLARRVLDLPQDVAAKLTGALTSQGSLVDPTSLQMTIDVERAEVSYGATRLTSTTPSHVHYGLGVFHIGPMILAGAGAQLEVSGDVAAQGALSLHVQGKGDLRALSGMSPKVEWLGGRYDLDARVQGRLDAPLLEGMVKVMDGALRLTSSGQVVSEVQARVGLAGRLITIESGSAAVGGGTAAVSGQVVLAAGARPEIDLRADLRSVSIRPYQDLQMTVGGGLNLAGPAGDLELKGNLKIDNLRYTANFDLPRLIPQRRAPPLAVPTFEPGQSIHLNVRVQAPGNLLVTGNLIDAEFRADLMVTGTTERLGLLGSLTPLRAKARYRDNIFTVERASIDFTEEFRIFTEFDIRATTQACGMRIAVELHGDSDRYGMTPSGQDKDGPVGQQDVLTCLQFGLRLAELERLREGSGADSQDRPPGEGLLQDPLVQSGLGALLVVTGVDAQVRKLVPIDEVRLTSGWSSVSNRPTLRAVVGKELSRKLSLKYSRALTLEDVSDQQLSLEYEISDIATLQGSWMSARDVPVGDLGLDLELRWEFR